jgi:hypothetical protein
VVVIEFALDTDTKEVEAELNGALDGIALRQQAEEPELRTQSASEFPIMTISLSAEDGKLSSLVDYAREETLPLIEDVESVASADLVGGAERQIQVELDPPLSSSRIRRHDEPTLRRPQDRSRRHHVTVDEESNITGSYQGERPVKAVLEMLERC